MRLIRSSLVVSDPVARVVTTVLLRGIAFGTMGLLVAYGLSRLRLGIATPIAILVSPLLSIASQWINFGYFPVVAQLQLSVVSSVVGVLVGLAFRRSGWAVVALFLFAGGISIWGVSNRVTDDLDMAARATGLHVLAAIDDIPSGDEGFAEIVHIAFSFAEDNSHGTDAVLANRAAILALGVILGEQRLATVARREIDLNRTKEMRRLRDRITLQRRNDLARHFWVSAALVVILDEGRAYKIGVGKELMDSMPGGSGFSFVDMMANLAGIKFSNAATRSQSAARQTQLQLRRGVAAAEFLPDYKGLPEGISRDRLHTEFGGLPGAESRRINAEIRARLAAAEGLQ